jgi:hypothetical protein
VGTELLRYFGAAQQSDIQHGIAPRIEKMFLNVARRVSQGAMKLDDLVPTLEFIARRHPPAWLLLADLYEEDENLEKAKDAVRGYLAYSDKYGSVWNAWNRLVSLCRRTNDYVGEIHALIEMCKLPDAYFERISNAANRINHLFSGQFLVLDSPMMYSVKYSP